MHYSEWVHALRHEIGPSRCGTSPPSLATVHPACHYYKIVDGDAIYDPEIYGASAPPSVTGSPRRWAPRYGLLDVVRLLRLRLPPHPGAARLHPLLCHSAQDRGDEAGGRPDVVLTNDTGCVTTLDKSQFVARAKGLRSASR